MYKKTNNKGITLIALVITIIILLILAGVSISALTGSGLFEKAKEAKQKSENAQAEENAILKDYESTLNEYLSGTGGSSSEENEETQATLANKVKVGDYVKYTPDTASTDSILEELGTYSGSPYNTTDTLTQETSLNWRVLDINDGKVRLISELPTKSKVRLYGAKGYNNAVYLLDKTCNTLYSNSTYAEKVQSLKIEDIQDYLTYDYTQYANSYVDTGKYGGTKTYTGSSYIYYPNIFVKEKTGWVDETQRTELDLSEQTTPIDESSTQAGTSIKITQTYWGKTMEETDFTDSIYYNLFISSKYSQYWMSSRCVNADSSYAIFYVRLMTTNSVSACRLFSGYGTSGSSSAYTLRPVITLKSDVQIDTTDATKDGTTAANAYVLK